jgi:hypothetical protein
MSFNPGKNERKIGSDISIMTLSGLKERRYNL